MEKRSTLILLGLISSYAFNAYGQDPMLVKESTYSTTNQLRGEKMFHYNAKNQQMAMRNELEPGAIFFQYDENGNMTQEEARAFNEWDNVWEFLSVKQCNYSPTNKVATAYSYNVSIEGEWTMIDYKEYRYNDQDILIEEMMYNNDTKDVILDKIEYRDFNENGMPGTKNYYFIDGNNVGLTGYNKYLYNNQNQTTQEDCYTSNINTGEITLSSRISWVYNNDGKVETHVVYRVDPSDNSLGNDNKTEYTYDETTGQLLSTEYYFWNSDKWSRSNIKRYTYSEQLDGTKAPRNLRAESVDNTYSLTWEAPENTTGLTGYNVYNGHEKITTVDGSNPTFTITETPTGMSYIFVTAVYGNEEANASDYISVEAIQEENTGDYPAPLFKGVKNAKDLGDGTCDIELYWDEPETDKEIEGYFACYNGWPQNADPVKGTSVKFNVFSRNADITLGVYALYADGTESTEHSGEYNLGDLLTSIMESASEKDIWSVAGAICINGNHIREVEIYDASGMKIREQQIEAGINILHLPADLYIIKAVTEQGVVSKKILNK